MQNINLSDDVVKKKKASKTFKKLLPVILILSLVVGFALFLTASSSSRSAINLIFKSGYGVRSNNDRVNVLFLGNAGGTHAGAYLTDTIIIASIDLKDNKVNLFSLPRDLWIDSIKVKINAAYEKGAQREDGLRLSREVVEDILGLPIHYGVRIDFKGFVKAIDELGGIDIIVDNPFDDYHYPIEGKENDLCGLEEKEMEFSEEEAKKLNVNPGKMKVFILPDGKIATDSADSKKGMEYFSCRYEQISFSKGLSHMNGETALKFVRSRMGTGGEGSDFARSKRQQQVLEAVRAKALSLDTLLKPAKITSLVQTFGESFETDISLNEILEFYKISKKISIVDTFVFDDSEKGLLINPLSKDYGGAYVLIPKLGSYDQIHQKVQEVLSKEVNSESSSTARPRDN